MEQKRNRHTLRMQGFDYNTPGAYFVTICTRNRELLFEHPTLAGIAQDQWSNLSTRFPTVKPDIFVVMPNHIHGILWLDYLVGAPLAGALARHPVDATNTQTPATSGAGASPAPTLGDVVGAYKSLVATYWLRWVKANVPSQSAQVWQRNYYEHVVRSEEELYRIRQYIAFNPIAWEFDHENPQRVSNTDYEKAWSWLEQFP